MRWKKSGTQASEAFIVGQGQISHVIENAGVLYWGTSGNAISRAKTSDPPGGIGTKIASMFETPARMATDGIKLVIAGTERMWTVPVTGGMPAELVTDPNWYLNNTHTAGVAIYGDTIYWSEYIGGRVAKMKAGALSTLSTGTDNLGTIAVDAKGIFWMGISSSAAKLWTLEGGGPSAVFQGEKATAFSLPKVVIDDKAAYFSIDPATGKSLIRRRDRVTSTVRVLVSGQLAINDIVVDATHLYWVTDSSVYRIALP